MTSSRKGSCCTCTWQEELRVKKHVWNHPPVPSPAEIALGLVLCETNEAFPLVRMDGLAAYAGSSFVSTPVDIDSEAPRIFVRRGTVTRHGHIARSLAQREVLSF